MPWLHDARLFGVVGSARGWADALVGDGDSPSFGSMATLPNGARNLRGAIRPKVGGGFAASARPRFDLALVAQGRLDGFLGKPGLQTNGDTAAGCLLVRDAVGFVTDYHRGRSTSIHAESGAGWPKNDVLQFPSLHKLLGQEVCAKAC